MATIEKESFPRVATGQVVVGTSPVALSAHSLELKRGVRVKADAANTNTIWVGFSSSFLSNIGYPLAAGEDVEIRVEDLADVFVVSDAVSQDVAWIAQ